MRPGLSSSDESESAKLSPIQLYSGCSEIFSNGRTSTISAGATVCAATECGGVRNKKPSASANRRAKIFLVIKSPLFLNKSAPERFDAGMITAVGQDGITRHNCLV